MKAERLRVDQALTRDGGRGGQASCEGDTERDTVLIRGLTKVGVSHRASGVAWANPSALFVPSGPSPTKLNAILIVACCAVPITVDS